MKEGKKRALGEARYVPKSKHKQIKAISGLE